MADTSADAATSNVCMFCGAELQDSDYDSAACLECRKPQGKLSELQIAFDLSARDPEEKHKWEKIRGWKKLRHHVRHKFGDDKTDEQLWERLTDWLEGEHGLTPNEYLMLTPDEVIERLRGEGLSKQTKEFCICNDYLDPLIAAFDDMATRIASEPDQVELKRVLETMDNAEASGDTARVKQCAAEFFQTDIPPSAEEFYQVLDTSRYREAFEWIKHNKPKFLKDYSTTMRNIKCRFYNLEEEATQIVFDLTAQRTWKPFAIHRYIWSGPYEPPEKRPYFTAERALQEYRYLGEKLAEIVKRWRIVSDSFRREFQSVEEQQARIIELERALAGAKQSETAETSADANTTPKRATTKHKNLAKSLALIVSTAQDKAKELDQSKEAKEEEKPGKKPTVNDRMIAELARNSHKVSGWTCRQWARHLKCQSSTVTDTAAWKELGHARRVAKQQKRADRRNGRSG